MNNVFNKAREAADAVSIAKGSGVSRSVLARLEMKAAAAAEAAEDARWNMEAGNLFNAAQTAAKAVLDAVAREAPAKEVKALRAVEAAATDAAETARRNT